MKDFHPPAQRFGKGFSAHRHNHEFLEIHVVVGVRAAIQNVHHRYRQDIGGSATQVAVQRESVLRRGGSRHCHRNGKNRISSQAALILRSIKFNHGMVDRTLFRSVHIRERVGYLAGHILDRLENALSEIARVIAIA